MKRGKATFRKLVAAGLAVAALLLAGFAADAAAVGPRPPGNMTVSLGRPAGPGPGEPVSGSAPSGPALDSSSPNPAGGTTGSDPGSDPDPTPGLPSCTYGDTMTTYRSAATDDRSLVDTEWRLPSTYAPDDLVAVSRAGLTGGGRIRRLVVDDLTAMARSARAAGARLAVQSAYRSYATQVATFNRWVSQDGYARARLASARPGHSEHQLGTTIDFKSYRGTTPWSHGDWGTTKAGTWLRTHAWEYGFVMSYPKGKRAVTCYKYEPWHFRYVGRAAAEAINASGLTLREWLWRYGANSDWG